MKKFVSKCVKDYLGSTVILFSVNNLLVHDEIGKYFRLMVNIFCRQSIKWLSSKNCVISVIQLCVNECFIVLMSSILEITKMNLRLPITRVHSFFRMALAVFATCEKKKEQLTSKMLKLRVHLLLPLCR